MKILSAITEEQWYNHPTFRQDLERVLADPAFLTALAMVQQKGLKPTSFAVPGVDLRDFFALMGAKRDGYFEAITNLMSLTQPKTTRPPERPPWTTPRPEADADTSSAP